MGVMSTAAFAARIVGIAASVCIAGSLAWAGVQRDAENGMAAWITKANLKKTYRSQPGILTCRTPQSIFAELSPQKTVTVKIPAPEDRDAGFDLEALDNAVDDQDCTLDTSQQVMWLATHQTVAPRVAQNESATRPNRQSLNGGNSHRASDGVRGLASAQRRAL